MNLSILALSLGAVGPLVSSADAETFTANTTISETNLLYENEDIIIEGCTVTIDGHHAFNSLTIRKNAINQPGVLTHSPAVEGLVLEIAGDVTIEGPTGNSGSKINLDGRGWKGSQGPGAGQSFISSGGGGGYGGAGGDASDASQATLDGGLGGECYGFQPDELFFPTKLGSGGGNRWNGNTPVAESGGSGGGAIQLMVGGALTLNGAITANGGAGSAIHPAGGRGSGGSIFLQSQLLTGAGEISANGGAGGVYNDANRGGGGGGGRIAIHTCNQLLPSNQITVIGGSGFQNGQPGTKITLPDVDSDGLVGLAEHSMLPDCFSGPGGGIPSDSCDCFDPDADGDVDLRDIAILQQAFAID